MSWSDHVILMLPGQADAGPWTARVGQPSGLTVVLDQLARSQSGQAVKHHGPGHALCWPAHDCSFIFFSNSVLD
jgi:hypothetical protein